MTIVIVIDGEDAVTVVVGGKHMVLPHLRTYTAGGG